MVCGDCLKDAHGRCRGGTWCDCQHFQRIAGRKPGASRDKALVSEQAAKAILASIRRYQQKNGGRLGLS